MKEIESVADGGAVPPISTNPSNSLRWLDAPSTEGCLFLGDDIGSTWRNRGLEIVDRYHVMVQLKINANDAFYEDVALAA